jgi:predicted dehydrogenase
MSTPTYAPGPKPGLACAPGEFRFAAIGFDHAHITGQCEELIAAGGQLTWGFDPDPAKLAAFTKAFPQARAARSEAEILEDRAVHLVTAAAVPDQRSALGIRVMEHGKDYFTDKTPMTTLAQLEDARLAVARTKRKYLVNYGRINSECGIFAGELIKQGAIGRLIHIDGLGPHRLNAPQRPRWFFEKQRYGGILCDIGSHQMEHFLAYSGATDARITASRVANYGNPDYPELEDFGDAMAVADNGATLYFRVDWFTPKGLRAWGDGRTMLIGTEGYIELRHTLDITRDNHGEHCFLVDRSGEHHFQLNDQVGSPFYGQMIRDCLDRTETAMTQAHAFKAAELCLLAQAQAVRIT